MTRLPSERLADYLDQWAYARVTVKAQLWTALKTVYSLTYFERPDVLAAMSMPILCGGPER